MVPNVVEQNQYFAIFQHLDWEFDQGEDFKKLVSFITAGILLDDGFILLCHKMLNLPPTTPQSPDHNTCLQKTTICIGLQVE